MCIPCQTTPGSLVRHFVAADIMVGPKLRHAAPTVMEHPAQGRALFPPADDSARRSQSHRLANLPSTANGQGIYNLVCHAEVVLSPDICDPLAPHKRPIPWKSHLSVPTTALIRA